MTAAKEGTAVRLGPVEEIPPGEGRGYVAGGEQVAVFRLHDGTLRATAARCPHAGGPLADGQIDPSSIVCPLHLRAFSFDDGRCAEGEKVTVYPVRDEGGEIVLSLGRTASGPSPGP